MAPLAWKVSARLASVCEDTPGFARATLLRFIPQTRVPRVRHASASDRAQMGRDGPSRALLVCRRRRRRRRPGRPHPWRAGARAAPRGRPHPRLPARARQVGGDGLFQEVLNGALAVRRAGGAAGAAAERLRLGHIPAGSTDAVACSLHGTRSAATAALHIALGDRRAPCRAASAPGPDSRP